MVGHANKRSRNAIFETRGSVVQAPSTDRSAKIRIIRTTHDFETIDVQKGKPFKDFGQGFYLTEIYEHARNLAIRNRRIEQERLRVMGNDTQLPVFVYEYEFDLLWLDKLNVKQFNSADREWLKFIIANRMNRTCQHGYELLRHTQGIRNVDIGKEARNIMSEHKIQLCIRKRNLAPADFVELDNKYGILRFIEKGYEPFHLTGTQGVVDEVDNYVHIQHMRR